MAGESLLVLIVMGVFNVAPWFVALNGRARRNVARSFRGVATDEDKETVEALALGLGVVMGLCFNFMSVAAFFGLIGR